MYSFVGSVTFFFLYVFFIARRLVLRLCLLLLFYFLNFLFGVEGVIVMETTVGFIKLNWPILIYKLFWSVFCQVTMYTPHISCAYYTCTWCCVGLCSHADCQSANQGTEFLVWFYPVLLQWLWLFSRCFFVECMQCSKVIFKILYVCRITVHIYVFNGASQKYKSLTSSITSVCFCLNKWMSVL